jgi:hypothetical protein
MRERRASHERARSICPATRHIAEVAERISRVLYQTSAAKYWDTNVPASIVVYDRRFLMEPHDLIPDPPLSPEEARVAASLSPDFIERIDRELLSHAKSRSRKVAMLAALAMNNPAVRAPGLPDLYYAQRIRALVAKGALVAEGNLDYMRYSEVRLPG